MYGAADLLRMMQTAGARGAENTDSNILIGTMTAHNSCAVGEELALAPEQLYFMERDTKRTARTCKPVERLHVSKPLQEGDEYLELLPENEEWDRNVYTDPFQEGDLVALVPVSTGRYLVLGRLASGEDVKPLEEQIAEDWRDSA